MRKAGLVVVMLILGAMVVSAELSAYTSPHNKATKYTYAKPLRTFASMPCQIFEPNSESPACYRDGVRECRVRNVARCFNECERHVRNVCRSRTAVPSCLVPFDFEKQFPTRTDCVRAAFEHCEKNCDDMNRASCRQRAYTKCSFIGRLFV